MWTYKISDGELLDPNGHFAGTGYSGKAGDWRNNPNAVAQSGLGPIPPGSYSIGVAHTSPNTGPITMDLDPLAGTNVFGRSLFRIHGDSKNHDASHGCLVIGPSIRQAISHSADKILHVID